MKNLYERLKKTLSLGTRLSEICYNFIPQQFHTDNNLVDINKAWIAIEVCKHDITINKIK